jgi:hypothetical protein
MGDDLEPDQELERLQSMHERVERLRSRLKDLKSDTYSAIGKTEEDTTKSADEADGVSKNYPQR